MKKFKVGDKVKIVGAMDMLYPTNVGLTGIVYNPKCNEGFVTVVFNPEETRLKSANYSPELLQLISTKTKIKKKDLLARIEALELELKELKGE